jgi:hypothetical protein
MATMKVAQIPKGESISSSLSARFLSRMSDTFALRCNPVVFATVTCSRKKALGPAFSIAGVG